MRTTDAVAQLVMELRAERLPLPVAEYPFAKEIGRRWRFDLCWLPKSPARMSSRKIALEIDGGVFMSKARHTSGKGFSADLEKLNCATEMGWRVFRVTPQQIRSGYAIDLLRRVLGKES